MCASCGACFTQLSKKQHSDHEAFNTQQQCCAVKGSFEVMDQSSGEICASLEVVHWDMVAMSDCMMLNSVNITLCKHHGVKFYQQTKLTIDKPWNGSVHGTICSGLQTTLKIRVLCWQSYARSGPGVCHICSQQASFFNAKCHVPGQTRMHDVHKRKYDRTEMK
jgi:hypothetical protein